MKNLLLFWGFVATFTSPSFSQISTIKVAERSSQVDPVAYDSTKNFLGDDVAAYIGQELYVVGMHKDLRRYGYKGFFNSPNRKWTYGGQIGYEKLVGKYFNVLEVIPKKGDAGRYFLHIKEKNGGDEYYFLYESLYERSFPFLVVGYFKKMGELYKGDTIVTKGHNWIDNSPTMTDIKTGQNIPFTAGMKWYVKDIAIEEEYFHPSLLAVNDKQQTIAVPLERLENHYWAISLRQLNNLNIPAEYYSKILTGAVSIGMTKDMCLYSWGTPQKINETINNSGVMEQWVYRGNQYLYFKDGLLFSID